MDTLKIDFAAKLLDVRAILLRPEEPFKWASGWLSPIYCDNRKTLSFPDLRNYIRLRLTNLVLEKYQETEAIVGVATGAIAQGALVADALHLPFAYVRSKPKDHGMGNMIEGTLPERAKVVVVEDLISTGGSSLRAVEALRTAGYDVVGMVASFTYGFATAQEAFRKAGVSLETLTDYDHVIEYASMTNYIDNKDMKMLKEWRKDPEHWGNVQSIMHNS